MNLTDFDYSLPPELIAQNPVEPRDQARLLVYDRSTNTISHSTVANLGQWLPDHTLITVNNSKVKQARIFASQSSQAKIQEILLIEDLSPTLKRCLIKGKGPTPGATFRLQDGLSATVIQAETVPGMTTYLLEFPAQIEQYLEKYGATPLPPYISSSSAPKERYQTVYAKELGSAAAPTAGLHFTPKLLSELQATGHTLEEVTLHVGIGTFLPLRLPKVEDNQLHSEITYISTPTAKRLTEQIQQHQPLLAVGTTSLRTLEGHYHASQITPGLQSTNIFLYPGARIQTANLLLTNFHLPKSSLLMLVATFLSQSPSRDDLKLTPSQSIAKLKQLYQTAIQDQYRFFSFGDAMLIR